jgi:hypothetical protein
VKGALTTQEERRRITALKAQPSRSRAETLAQFRREMWAGRPRTSRKRPDADRAAATPRRAAPTSDGKDKTDKLPPVTPAQILAAITIAYDDARQAADKPPNVMQRRQPVHKVLKQIGRSASGNTIMKLAKAEQHAARRIKPFGR